MASSGRICLRKSSSNRSALSNVYPAARRKADLSPRACRTSRYRVILSLAIIVAGGSFIDWSSEKDQIWEMNRFFASRPLQPRGKLNLQFDVCRPFIGKFVWRIRCLYRLCPSGCLRVRADLQVPSRLHFDFAAIRSEMLLLLGNCVYLRNSPRPFWRTLHSVLSRRRAAS